MGCQRQQTGAAQQAQGAGTVGGNGAVECVPQRPLSCAVSGAGSPPVTAACGGVASLCAVSFRRR